VRKVWRSVLRVSSCLSYVFPSVFESYRCLVIATCVLVTFSGISPFPCYSTSPCRQYHVLLPMNPHFASSKHIFQTPPFSDHTKSILRYIPNMLLLYLLVNTRVVQKRARFPSTLRESQSSPKNTQNVTVPDSHSTMYTALLYQEALLSN
jgi:hypothetical protein